MDSDSQINVELETATPQSPWELQLYIAGNTVKSATALANLQRICEQHLHGCYRLEVIDLQTSQHLAKDHKIVAVPALVRRFPAPRRLLIGDLSNTRKVLVGLDLPTPKFKA